MKASANRIARDTAVLRPRGRIRAAVVLIHGLNMRPECMDELAALLAGQGCLVVRGCLSGHGAGQTAADFATDGADGWVGDVIRMRAIARAAAPRVPLLLCGFSLGAAAGIAATLPEGAGKGRARCRYDAMLLVCPALVLRPWAGLVRFFFPWPGLSLPSLAGPRIQALPGIPVRGYRALFALAARVRRHLRSERAGRDGAAFLSATPTLVIFDRLDILTRPAGLARRLAAGHGWRFEAVRAANLWHHLVTDRRALGDAEWSRLGGLVAGWLRGVLPVRKGGPKP